MKIFIRFLILFCLQFNLSLFSQVGIGTSTPNASAILDLQSTNQGFLLPRMTTIQQKEISDPPVGLMILNLDSIDVFIFDGSKWLGFRDVTDTIFNWTCGDPFTDQRDGKIYSSVSIGTQCWMAKNLNVGTMITGSVLQSNNGLLEKNCYEDTESNCDIYGGLYRWDEMMQYTTTEGTQGICPEGWHIPTDQSWTILTDYLGGPSVAGGKMKSIGTIEAETGLWYSPNYGANNSSGFAAHPGGWRTDYFVYFGKGESGYFWTSTQSSALWFWDRFLTYYSNEIIGITGYWTNVYSVRCLKDD